MKSVVLPTLGCLFIAMSLLGCGKSVDLGAPVKVTGSVTLDGKPLDKATVGFVALSKGLPAKYRYVSAVSDASGNFSIPSVYPAEYSVTLSQEAPAGGGTAPADAAVPGNPKLAKYGANSPLRATVSKDSTTFKLDATSGR